MNAPLVDVQLSTGQTVPLKSLYEAEPLALVFLRHFGCMFCEQHVAQLRRFADTNLVFVTLGNAAQADEFRKRMNSPHRFIADPERKLHQLFDLPRGGLAQIITPHAVVRTLSGLFQGYMHRRGTGDPMQLPGVFVIEKDGRVAWQYRGKDMADTPGGEEIAKHLPGGTS